MQTLELVTFKTKETVTQQQIIQANELVMEEIQNFDGFLYRSLCFQKESETWLDVVYWENKSAAQSAQEKFMASANCQKLMSLIEIGSTNVQHADIVLSSPCVETETCG